MPDRRVNIADLVSNFRAHIKAYKSKETKEAEIRQQFIDPFWRALGWDVGDTKGIGPTESEVIIEKNVETVDAGVLGAEVWVKLVGADSPAPADPDALAFLIITMEASVCAADAKAAGGKAAVSMGRWVSTRGEKGPCSEEMTATVST